MATSALAASDTLSTEWTHAPDPLGRRGHPASVLPEYPRPQMVRASVDEPQRPMGLRHHRRRRGAARRSGTARSSSPSPVESQLSGVQRAVEPGAAALVPPHLHARRRCPRGGRLLLHFGAVDWEATVWVNGQAARRASRRLRPVHLRHHRCAAAGGPRSCSSPCGTRPTAVRSRAASRCSSRTASGTPRSPASGRRCGWSRCRGRTSTASVDRARHRCRHRACSSQHARRRARQPDRGHAPMLGSASRLATGTATVGQEITLSHSRRTALVARRSVPLRPDGHALRAGTWSTATSACARSRSARTPPGVHAALPQQPAAVPVRHARPGLVARRPLHRRPPTTRCASTSRRCKRLGFNMIRKHVKVEPERWYHLADSLGMLVWQDMPSGDNNTPAARTAVRRRAAADDRRATQPPVHRDVGAVQRGLGPARHREDGRTGSRRTTPPGWWTTPAAGPTSTSATSPTSTPIPGPAMPAAGADAAPRCSASSAASASRSPDTPGSTATTGAIAASPTRTRWARPTAT